MKLSLSVALRCGTCGNLRTTESVETNNVLIALFGVAADPFAVCPSCRADLHADDPPPEVRERIRRVYFQHGIVLRQLDNGEWRKVPL